MNYVWGYEDIDTLNVQNYTENQIVALETFKNYKKNGFSVYRNNKPLSKITQSEWQDTNRDESQTSFLPKASIAFRQSTSGFQSTVEG